MQNCDRHVHLEGYRNSVSVRDIIPIDKREGLIGCHQNESAISDRLIGGVAAIGIDYELVLFAGAGCIGDDVGADIEIGVADTWV